MTQQDDDQDSYVGLRTGSLQPWLVAAGVIAACTALLVVGTSLTIIVVEARDIGGHDELSRQFGYLIVGLAAIPAALGLVTGIAASGASGDIWTAR